MIQFIADETHFKEVFARALSDSPPVGLRPPKSPARHIVNLIFVPRKERNGLPISLAARFSRKKPDFGPRKERDAFHMPFAAQEERPRG